MLDVQLTRSFPAAGSDFLVELVESGDEQPETMIPSQKMTVRVMIPRMLWRVMQFLIPKFIFLINQNMPKHYRFH